MCAISHLSGPVLHTGDTEYSNGVLASSSGKDMGEQKQKIEKGCDTRKERFILTYGSIRGGLLEKEEPKMDLAHEQ